MICINLLPWRESKLAKIKKLLLCQLCMTIFASCIAVYACRSVLIDVVAAKRGAVKAYRQANQPVLRKVESLNTALLNTAEQDATWQRINQIINQKNRLPAILEKLTSERRAGTLSRLAVDQKHLNLEYSSADIDDTLSLFDLLNSHDSFCHVSFNPLGTTRIKPGNENKNMSGSEIRADDILRYEFEAKLCDIRPD